MEHFNRGVQTISLLVRSSPEALEVGKIGSESEYSAVASGQPGFCSDDVDEASSMIGLCSVEEEQPAQELSEAGGGLNQAPLLSWCSTLTIVMETSGSASETVDERIAGENLFDGRGVPQVTMVYSPLVDVKVGGDIGEAISVGNPVGGWWGEAFCWRTLMAEWRLGPRPRV